LYKEIEKMHSVIIREVMIKLGTDITEEALHLLGQLIEQLLNICGI
jgi:hypothetical protein